VLLPETSWMLSCAIETGSFAVAKTEVPASSPAPLPLESPMLIRVTSRSSTSDSTTRWWIGGRSSTWLLSSWSMTSSVEPMAYSTRTDWRSSASSRVSAWSGPLSSRANPPEVLAERSALST
jgi:hypothetical protein